MEHLKYQSSECRPKMTVLGVGDIYVIILIIYMHSTQDKIIYDPAIELTFLA